MSRRVIRRSLLHAPGGRMAHQSRVARWVSSTATLALLTTQAAVGQAPSRAAVAAPPVAPIRAVPDGYYGTTVVDPYRYIEDLQNQEPHAWPHARNDYTRPAPTRIPARQRLAPRNPQ